jgi:hypothetical protein
LLPTQISVIELWAVDEARASIVHERARGMKHRNANRNENGWTLETQLIAVTSLIYWSSGLYSGSRHGSYGMHLLRAMDFTPQRVSVLL